MQTSFYYLFSERKLHKESNKHHRSEQELIIFEKIIKFHESEQELTNG